MAPQRVRGHLLVKKYPKLAIFNRILLIYVAEFVMSAGEAEESFNRPTRARVSARELKTKSKRHTHSRTAFGELIDNAMGQAKGNNVYIDGFGDEDGTPRVLTVPYSLDSYIRRCATTGRAWTIRFSWR